jgi:PTH1 family peptidyl-tRNA hydrolase
MNHLSATSLYLIVGLGNPGRQFRDDRHNIGFMVLDRMTTKLELAFTLSRQEALITDVHIDEQKVILAKPQTFMNRAGESVSSLARYYRSPSDNILIIFDDLDIPLGTIRLRPQGGSGGHRGVRSIIENLGTERFPRMRLGIGRPPGRMDPADFVLQAFTEEESTIVDILLDHAVDAIHTFIRDGIEAAMTRYNSSVENE